ncbi:MAG: type III pantothenate kinase [Actinobacteria bacterium]|nr:type III pantothenate kinase [Actinomycetota bacterium]MBU1942298.1 type III pantothenate kinase [Actinomycetota bacterium]MBU2686379.1 type III pantothenate kinase [Actinomycetota bacterium]
MLLGIDVGNTQTVIGLFAGDELLEHWRISTERERTADEVALTLGGFMAFVGHTLSEIDGIIVSSVVPEMTRALDHMAKDILDLESLVVDSDTDTGVPILYEDPRQVGADRLVNAVAAIARYGTPCIVVDFGTATTWDAIDAEGRYLGGTIAPGVEISAAALFSHAARLSRVELVPPENAIGRNTVESMQSGIIHGTAGQVDRLVELFRRVLGPEARVVATGGLAEVVVGECRSVDVLDPLLTLEGLKLIYQRNRPG